MHRIIPEIIVANYRANNQRGSFMAASMFLDISGFSTMVDTLIQRGQFGSEVLAKMMRQVFDPIVNAVFEQGGLIVGYAGDAVTALYPIETDPVEAARRALASAYCIQQGMLSNPFYETPFGTFRISAKIGLAVGGVSWGILRSRNGEKATYYFRGIAVDDASKAEHQARAGEILLAQEIYELLNGNHKN